jgi:heat-inducible transcriptional repressor
MQTRQQTILELLIKEYIKTAEPVGSQILVEGYKLDISPATVRNEMAELEEAGYLLQPHTSAGRVPTDKGYRFFVDNLADETDHERDGHKTLRLEIRKIQARAQEYRAIIREIARTISAFSSGVGMCGFIDEEAFFSAGLSNLFKDPDFVRSEDGFEFMEAFDSLEEEIKKVFNHMEKETEVFIGRENMVDKFDDFSMVISKCKMGNNKKGVLGVLGPKRMDYARNIALIEYLRESFENF